MERQSTRTRWAVDPRSGLALLRVTLGVLFLSVFLENIQKGLYAPDAYARFIEGLAARGEAPLAWKSVMRFVASHAGVAAPLQAATEVTLGILLCLGLFTRLAAVAAFLFLGSLWVSEWGTAWIWELLLPMLVALLVGLTNAGLWAGVDAVLSRRRPGLSFG
jgi:uncharacterized membrane protein YphA (DoxX/SURF4 family)